jgi:hypothetical protein
MVYSWDRNDLDKGSPWGLGPCYVRQLVLGTRLVDRELLPDLHKQY